jgi:hypothetical protein
VSDVVAREVCCAACDDCLEEEGVEGLVARVGFPTAGGRRRVAGRRGIGRDEGQKVEVCLCNVVGGGTVVRELLCLGLVVGEDDVHGRVPSRDGMERTKEDGGMEGDGRRRWSGDWGR